VGGGGAYANDNEAVAFFSCSTAIMGMDMVIIIEKNQVSDRLNEKRRIIKYRPSK
jgi:hypothetical protein